MANWILNKIRQKVVFKFKLPSKFKLHKAQDEQDEQDLGLFNKAVYENLESAMRMHPYLASYLTSLPEQPKYSLNIESEHFENEVNVIYPLGLGIYAHIIMNEESDKYNLVEPAKPERKLLDEMEAAVAKLVKGKDYGEQKDKILASLFRQAVKSKLVKIPKGTDEDILLYHFLREKIGHGFLDGFLADPGLEDISIPGAGSVFVYHKMFGNLETSVNVSQDEVDDLLRNIAERHGKVLSYTHPIIDIHLSDGSRLNIVFGEDISLRGSNFTIRKFPIEPISVAQLIKWHTITAELAAYLWMLFEVGVSALICGETASGKTTTLNALTGFIDFNSKIISIEETPEINIYHKNWIREVTRLHTGVQVTMFDLLKAALRQRPDYIIVGELRGEEARVAFQAVETGHPVLSTMHAGNLGQLFQRLTSHPIDIPKSHIDGLNLVIFQARMERGKKFIRRCTSISEVIGYEPDTSRLNYLPTCIYDADLDKFRFMGSSFHLENKVLAFRGWGKERIRDIYEELQARAEILNYLAENFPSYTEVSKTMITARNLGIWAVHRKIKEMKVPWI
ncbi:MAG TPA: type II/IV secretion system ATPase subunit [Candidatus Bathyarchaeia archaeon]|nr:type II/IV secretion system ATPase subunit [Candidatus Bathyarchaeia archaeon]